MTLIAIQLAVCAIVTIASICIQAGFAISGLGALPKFAAIRSRPAQTVQATIYLSALTLWLMLALFICINFWAATLIWLGIFPSMAPAFYFASVAYTTLGFGDVTLPAEWFILPGFIAANGLFMFSLSTATLLEAVSAVRRAEIEERS